MQLEISANRAPRYVPRTDFCTINILSGYSKGAPLRGGTVECIRLTYGSVKMLCEIQISRTDSEERVRILQR